MKRATLGPLLFLAAVVAVRAGAAEEASPEKTAVGLVTPAAERAMERGLHALAGMQLEDGSFGSGGFRGNAGICALAGLAFIAGGSTPDRGPHGQQVTRCVDYLLACAQPSGFVVQSGQAGYGPMYGHGFATMFLAECYGMSQRPELREKLERAVQLTVNCQNDEGGWRYEPQRMPGDISVTVSQVMALRAARNAGIEVPRETIERAIGFVKRSQNPDGGFMYMLNGGESAFPRSAAGVVALYSAGVYDSPEITKGLDYLTRFQPKPDAAPYEGYFFYGHYYAMQAMWHAGGERWQNWYPAVRDQLIARQQEDGSWTGEVSTDYCTAMACLALEVPNNVVPIFQR